MPGLVTLIGSGEVSAGMTRVHRALLAKLPGTPRPAFLSTPAGFELGLEAIEARFRDYVERRLGLPLAVASFRGADDDPRSVAAALAAVTASDYILAGPGSPTYAVRQWCGSAVYAAVVERWQAGAHLVWASSAAIALGRHALPVYEIYKVGEDLHWEDGLDLLGPYGFELAIVPHWDNAEGGTHDTRACFMGMERFERLRHLLPPTAVVLAVDEHTACSLDLDAGMGEVRGRGGVAILQGDRTMVHKAGETFPLGAIAGPAPGIARPASAAGSERGAGPGAVARASALIADGDIAVGLRQAAEAASPNLAPVLHQAADALGRRLAAQDASPALVQLLIEARQALREAKQWALSDRLRDSLEAMGISIHDTVEGTVWGKRP